MRNLLDLGSASAEAFTSAEQRSEAVVVLFSSLDPAKEATLHFFVIHAQIILLTFLPRVPQTEHPHHKEGRVAEELHKTLLCWWFNNGEAPQAFLLATREEAVLIPDWLKLKMIRSDSAVLVDTALRELDSQQLVLFIQSFGIPVASMSKLLGALDSAAERNPVRHT